MIEYYYKSKSDVLFKRVSLEHKRKTNIDKKKLRMNLTVIFILIVTTTITVVINR